VWRLVLIGAFMAWCFAVGHWASVRHYEVLTRGWRPLYAGLAALTFWPVVGLLWCVAYPSDAWPAAELRSDGFPDGQLD